jgi:hypothetical protein
MTCHVQLPLSCLNRLVSVAFSLAEPI